MKYFCLITILVSTFTSAEPLTFNAYRYTLELLLQEPSSGRYSKSDAAPVQELWLSQKLDHFDELNNKTWQMRYLRNDKFHKPQGPIYIFVGGEWAITPGLLSTGLTHDMAVENAGILFYTEHRYYGQSWPHNSSYNSLSLENLKHLNLHQALADLAYFIRYQKSHSANLTHSKVILIGGSYSGSMVTWMTQLYPELVTASWASSAPLLAKADFYEYMQFVVNSINLSYGHNCTQRLENGFNHLVKLFNTNETSKLLERLNACQNFNASDLLDRTSFFNGIGNYFALVVQSYSEYIPAICETLMSLHSSDELALEFFLERLYSGDDRRLSEFRCQDFSYKAMLELFSDVSDRSTGTRAWFYQTCNEFGWYTTTTDSSTNASSGMSFGSQVPVWYFEQLCCDAFGPGQTPAVLAMGIAQITAQFGGIGFNQSVVYREVFFTHGELDPWRALGQQHGKQAVIIAGYSHVEDLASVNVRDSVQMNLVKLRIMSFLRRHVAS